MPLVVVISFRILPIVPPFGLIADEIINTFTAILPY